VTTVAMPGGAPLRAEAPAHTGSRGTRVLGGFVAAGLALLAILGLYATPPEVSMGQSVRIMYVHVPSAIAAYAAFSVTALGSILWLWRRSRFWDLAAACGAEIGVVFTSLTLATGMLWGKPTWGVYWDWDPRLTTTALLLLLFLGYLAVRATAAEPDARRKRSAVMGLVAFVDVPIVHFSVDWWRSLHQPTSVRRLDPTIEGLMLFTYAFGVVVFLALAAWWGMHRFRVAWLEEQAEEVALEAAIAERRSGQGTGAEG
jgi:heme exporter protein C